jgi:phosphoribosylformylglycinamidine synthase
VSTAKPKPRVAVITFPGSNDDHDAALALTRLGAEALPVWHADRELPDVRAVVLPGGFSYGDYLRAGALARFAPVMDSVRALAADGGLVLGICNHSLSFVCRDVPLTVERTDTPFTARCAMGQRLSIPIKHGEGCFFAGPELLSELEQSGQIVLRYEGENPNGSVAGIAGIVNAEGNVMGLMPHPEHAVDALTGSTDGALLLGSLVDAARVDAAEPAAV